jgi:hypothetical protein
MAYFFLSDGGPDAEDYDNNYFRYNASDTEVSKRIEYIVSTCDTQNPTVRAELQKLCKASFHCK